MSSIRTSYLNHYGVGNLAVSLKCSRSHVAAVHYLSDTWKYGYCNSAARQVLLCSFSKRQLKHSRSIKLNANDNDHHAAGTPLPSPSSSEPPPSGWRNWFLLTLLPMILPFLKHKLGPLQSLKNRVDTALETAECVAEVMEDISEKVDKIAEDVGENLPEGSKLKDIVGELEDAAERSTKAAQLAQELVDKVQDLMEKADNPAMDHQEEKVVPVPIKPTDIEPK